MGFEEEEALDNIQSEIPGFSGFNTDGGLFGQVEVQKPTFSHTISASPETLSALRGISHEGLTVRETDSGEVKVTVIGGIDASLEESIIATVPESERRDLSNAVESYRTLNRHLLSPAERGEKLGTPRLMSEIQGSLEFADTDVFMEYSDWSLLNHPARLDENEFTIREMERSFEIDIDGRQVRYRFLNEQEQLPLAQLHTSQRSEHSGDLPYRNAHSIVEHVGRRHHSSPYPVRAGPVLVRRNIGMPPSDLLAAGPAPTYLHPVPRHLGSGNRRNVGCVDNPHSLMLESASTSGAGVLRHRHLYKRLGDFIGRRRLSIAERPHTRLAAGTLGAAASPTLGERSRLALSCSLELGDLLAQLFLGRRQLRNSASTVDLGLCRSITKVARFCGDSLPRWATSRHSAIPVSAENEES